MASSYKLRSPINVYISSSGRRNDLVAFFRSSPLVGEIHCGDMDEYTPSQEAADELHKTPEFTDPEYENCIADICRSRRIGLALTINDFELLHFARLRDRLATDGTVVAVSSPDVIAACLDKLRSRQFLARNGFDVPRCFPQDTPSHALTYPVVIKPRFGTGSIAVSVAKNASELDLLRDYSRMQLRNSRIPSLFDQGMDLLLEEQISGTEYAIDIVNDFDGNYQGCVIKRKLAKRGGDASLVVTERSPRLEDWSARLGSLLGHRGNLDCDVFANDHGIYCVDLNPRFGGAYPFSHLAGVNVPEMLVRWARGDNFQPTFDYQPGAVIARTEAYLRLRRPSRPRQA